MSQKSPKDLHDLLIVKIKSLYHIEDQLVKALPKMAEASTDLELKQGFKDHLRETQDQVKRLEEIFKHLEIAPVPETSDAIRGLVADAKWCIDNVEKGPALDASLIAAAQYVEKFETAGYGAAMEWAKIMGHREIQNLLNQTLGEEKSADEKLTKLALSKINKAANTMSEGEGSMSKDFLGKLQTGNA